MTDAATTPRSSAEGWQPKQVYILAIICLMVGLAIGYLFRDSKSPTRAIQGANSAKPGAPQQSEMAGQLPTLDQMRHMADVKAEPLLLKLKTDGPNADLLFQIGNIYRAAHQFQDAAGYYQKSLAVDPRNVIVRTELASCLYYAGDADGALAQLEQARKDDPKNANVLFNLGVIRRDAKNDKQGAVAAWRELLKTNPDLAADKKSTVKKLIAEATAPANKS
jgi:cytochrome c-type biogenesis protein CcmH/NrfG